MDTKKPLIPIKSVEEIHDYSQLAGEQIMFETIYHDGTIIKQTPEDHYNMLAERGKHEDAAKVDKVFKRLRSKEPKLKPRSFHTNLQTNLNIDRIQDMTGFSLSYSCRMGLGLLLALLERDQQLYQQRVDTMMQRLGISPEQLQNRITEEVKYRIEKVEVRLLDEDEIPDRYKSTIDESEEKPV